MLFVSGLVRYDGISDMASPPIHELGRRWIVITDIAGQQHLCGVCVREAVHPGHPQDGFKEVVPKSFL